jgi:thiol-disulfide isomerase/thioredoxin
VFGKEFYYGNGICSAEIGKSPFGSNPAQKLLLGVTEVSKDLFHEFLKDISEKYTKNNFNLESNNCLHFADEAVQLLTGTSISKELFSQPKEDLSVVEFRKMVVPVFDRFVYLLQTTSRPLNQPNNTQPIRIQPNIVQSKIIEINTEAQLEELIFTNEGVIVDFWSPMCAPCAALRSVYNELAESNTCSRLIFCAVNISTRQSIGTIFQVKSVPSLMFYHKSELIGSVIGNFPVKLREEYEKLKKLIEYPKVKLKFKAINKELIQHNSLIQKDQMKTVLLKAIGEYKDRLKVKDLESWIEKDYFSSIDNCSDKIIDQVFILIKDIGLVQRLPFVDLMRITVLFHKDAGIHMLKSYMKDIMELIVTPVLEVKEDSNKRLVFLFSYILKVLANAFTHTETTKLLEEYKDLHKVILSIIDNGLNNSNSQVVYSAISLLNNIVLVDKVFDDKERLEFAKKIVKVIKDDKVETYAFFWLEVALVRILYSQSVTSLEIFKNDPALREVITKKKETSEENVKKISEDVIQLIWN